MSIDDAEARITDLTVLCPAPRLQIWLVQRRTRTNALQVGVYIALRSASRRRACAAEEKSSTFLGSAFGARGPSLGTLFQPCVAARLELMNSMNTRQPSRRQPRQVLGSPALQLDSSSLPKRILCQFNLVQNYFDNVVSSSPFLNFALSF